MELIAEVLLGFRSWGFADQDDGLQREFIGVQVGPEGQVHQLGG